MWARSSTPTPASSRRRPTGDAHGRRAPEVVALAHEVVVVGVGAAVREHPAVARHAERLGPLGRAQDQRGALLDRVVGVQPLRVREADHPVVGRRRADLLGGVRLLDPGVRVGGGHRAEPGPQLRHGDEVLVEPAAEHHPVRLLEQRVHLHRHHHAAGLLAGRRHRHLGDRPRRLGHRLVLPRPVELGAGRPGAHPGAPRLGAAEEHEVRRRRAGSPGT